MRKIQNRQAFFAAAGRLIAHSRHPEAAGRLGRAAAPLLFLTLGLSLPGIARALNSPPVHQAAVSAGAPAAPNPVTTLPGHKRTPKEAVRHLAIAIKRGDAAKMRQLLTAPKAIRPVIRAFTAYIASTQRFLHVAEQKLGKPPAGSGLAAHGLDADMDRLIAALPRATVAVTGRTAVITFSAARPARKPLHLLYTLHGWEIDGMRMLRLNRHSLSTSALRNRAGQLRAISSAMDAAIGDLKAGKISTWNALEKDMYTRVLETTAETSAHRKAARTPGH